MARQPTNMTGDGPAIEANRWTLDTGNVRRWFELAAATDDVVRMAVNET